MRPKSYSFPKVFLAVLSSAIILLAFSVVSFSLDAEYEKNGEVYMLIGGTSPTLRGVYNLNNKDTQKGIELLYDPGQAYGINVDRDRIIYTYNISPISDTTWTQISGNIQVSGVSSLGTQSGTHHYVQDTGSKCVGCTVQGVHSISNGILTMPNGFWYHMPSDNRCRKITRYKWNQVYDLLKWGVTTKPIGADPDIHKQRIAVKARAKESYFDINRCHDGCGGINGGGDLPIVEPITDIAINGKGDAYFYRRTVGGSDGAVEKNGQIYSGGIIGSLNDPTSKFIAISTGAVNDYIYVLGNSVIKNWLVNANFGSSNPGFNLNSLDITKIVVSDQWWSTGGIVYAFDKPSNNVYKFVRNEVSGSYDVEAISIDSTDGDVDSIATDGFGSLYYVKTYKQPNVPENFIPGTHTSLTWTNKNIPGGYALGYAEYRQKVSKGVFKLDIFGGAPRVIGEKVVGYNTYRRNIEVRPYSGSEYLGNTSIWDSQPYAIQGEPVSITSPVEIASINFGTPPEVAGFLPGHVDIAGPYKIGDTDNPFNPYTVSEWTGFEENEFYMFIAENFPLTNTYGINIRSKDLQNDSASMISDTISEATGVLSKNTLGWTGGLPSSVDISSVRYKWEIFQVKDRFGNDKDSDNNPLRRQVWPPPGDSSVPLWCDAPVMGIFFDGGEYEICLAIRYNWWNYAELPFGASVSDRDACYKTGQMCVSDSSGGTTSKMRIKVKPKTVNELTDSGQIVLKVFNGTTNQWVSKTPVRTTNDNNNYVNYFVVDQGANCRWEMFERPVTDPDPNRINDRTNVLTTTLPPAPPTGTRYDNLKWDQDLIVKWKFELPDPRTPDANDTLVNIPNVMFRDDPTKPFLVETPLSDSERNAMGWGNDAMGLKRSPRIFSIPSDPYLYTVYSNAYKGYSYDMFAKISLKDDTGRIIMDKMVKLPYKRIVQMEAMALVLVRDTEPPKVFTGNSASLTPTALAGTTGDPLSSPSDGTSNPEILSMIFEDNNPFGNDSIICTIQGVQPQSKHNLNNMEGAFNYETCYEVKGPDTSDSVSNYYLEHKVSPKFVSIPNLTSKTEADDPAKGLVITEPRKIHPSNGDLFCTPLGGTKWNRQAQFFRYTCYKDDSKNSDPVVIITNLIGAEVPSESEGGSIFRSYFRISIPLAELDEFSPQGASLPTYYATNRDNYRPLGFSFRASDSSGNASGFNEAGNIDIKDTHKPYITLEILNAREPGTLVNLPQRLTAGGTRNPYETWHLIDDKDWIPQDSGILASPFPESAYMPLPLHLKSLLSTELFSTKDPADPTVSRNLEEDLRYKAMVRIVDNVPHHLIDDSDPSKMVPNLKNQLTTKLTSSAGFGWSRPEGLSHSSDSNYLIFRKRGNYWVEFQVRDNVVCTAGAGSEVQYPDSIEFSASPAYHLRNIRYYIDVENTMLSVHTIEGH